VHAMIYELHQAQMDMGAPARLGAAVALSLLRHAPTGMSDKLLRQLAAALELISRAALTYKRPAYGIHRARGGNRDVEVTEDVIHATPFCSLLHFKKAGVIGQPRLLLVAPMSGHFATLLRGTVQTLLTDHDVFITDWHSARDVQGPGALQQLAETRLTIKLTVYNYGTAWHLYAWDSFAMRSVVA
jgi:poly(3-hydroxybutyrate) depolymerase